VPDFIHAFSSEFDVSEDSTLGGLFYAMALKTGVPGINLYTVNPDETNKLIVQTEENRRYLAPAITTTPDGALYMLCNDATNSIAHIYRITANPISLAIRKLESAIAEKNVAIENIESAIATELLAIEKLEEIDSKDAHKAKMKIASAIHRQKHVKDELEKSIRTLRVALEILKNSLETE
jgi:predicted amino acid-binding ACT domain protein